jgi:hypothetical protein
LRCSGFLFMAVAPPPSGLLVSIVSCAVAVPFGARAKEMLEKWQLTPAGSDPQPRPMVSVKPATEVSVTVSVAFWPVGMLTVAGVTVRPNDVPLVVIETEADWDGAWIESPP